MGLINEIKSEEIVLAQRAVAFVACFEPLSDAGCVEFIFAVFAGHFGETLIRVMDYTVANETVFDPI